MSSILLQYPQRTIENCFAGTHPIVGDNFRCATGEPYTAYAIAAPTYDEAAEMLINTFRVLSGGCAPQKFEGAPVVIAEPKKKYLYWRRPPEIIQNKGQEENIPLGFWVAYCRAVVSTRWVEEGQLA